LLPIGTVTQASGAHFNVAVVSAGATVYDGDGLSTEAEGTLQFRGNGALVYLPGASTVNLHRLSSGVQAQLRSGTVVFSAARATAVEILAVNAVIRPLADVPTIAQITILGPKELQIRARRGSLQFSYRAESATILEGSSYRILLDPPEASTAPKSKRGPKNPLPENISFKIIIGTAVGLITAIALREVFESPDRP
jgi:hypothetical protein